MQQDIVSIDAIVEVVEQGGWFSRRDIAEALGRDKTTHVVSQIERAVRLGKIERFPGFIGRQRGWVYGPPGQQLGLWDE